MKKEYLKKIIPYLLEHKLMFFTSMIFMVFVSFLKLLGPLILAHIIDVSVPDKNINDMFMWSIFFVMIIILSGIFTYFQTIFLAKMGVKIIAKIKMQVFEHLLLLPISYFDKNPVGKLIARVESDAEKVKQLFSQFSIMIIGNLLFFLGMIIVLFTKNVRITLYLIIPIPIIVSLVFIVLKYLRKYYKRIRIYYADLSAVLTEYIQGIIIIQLFNKENKVLDIIKDKSKKKKDIEQKTAFIEYSFWSLYGFLIEIVFIILVIFLITPKILAGVMTLGTLIIFIEYGMRIFEPLLSISESFNLFQRAFVSMERIFNIIDLKKEEKGIDFLPIKFNNYIEFKNVWFKYKENEWVLKDISFTIEKGKKIALVGASGSGKSTTISLLMRFYNINKGNIFVDGNSIYDFNIKDWRRKIGLVLQDIFLFPGNILENVRIYNNAISEKQVIEALEIVGGENLLSKENGIYTLVSERGQNLSVGEKQLISFARAIVFSPEIIIMDEATSSIDMQTEIRIQNALNRVLKNKTAIIVAHRLSSVINADKILLFQNGKIIASGNHKELLNSSDEYKKLVKLQFLHSKEEK